MVVSKICSGKQTCLYLLPKVYSSPLPISFCRKSKCLQGKDYLFVFIQKCLRGLAWFVPADVEYKAAYIFSVQFKPILRAPTGNKTH